MSVHVVLSSEIRIHRAKKCPIVIPRCKENCHPKMQRKLASQDAKKTISDFLISIKQFHACSNDCVVFTGKWKDHIFVLALKPHLDIATHSFILLDFMFKYRLTCYFKWTLGNLKNYLFFWKMNAPYSVFFFDWEHLLSS